MLHKDDCVSSGEIKPEPPDVRGEEQHVDGWVSVELLLHLEAPCVGRSSVLENPGDARLSGCMILRGPAEEWMIRNSK